MSTWRKTAIDKLPEFRHIIQSSVDPSTLWVELEMKFSEVYARENPDDDLIRRIYEFAFWCLSSPGEGRYLSAAGNAAFLFFENVAWDKKAAKDLHRWISREQFLSLTDAFKYLLSKEEFEKFASEFFAKVDK